jgi:hypothetical protein
MSLFNKPPSIDAEAKKSSVIAATLSNTSALTNAKAAQSAESKNPSKVTPVQDKLAEGAIFKDNILQTFDSSAYYLRLTMINPALVEEFNPQNGVVIAETGTTTDIVIKECVLNTIVGWSPKSQGAFASSGKMTLIEPLGVKFLDILVSSARALRIPNHTQARYYLEVGFTGRDNETGDAVIIPSGNSAPTSGGNRSGSSNDSKSFDFAKGGTESKQKNSSDVLPHIWSIFFVKVDMTISENGGVYNIEFRNQLEAAQENTVENLKDVVNIPANNLADYFKGLAKSLNDREAKNVGITKFVKNEFNFVLDPEISPYKFANFMPNQVSKAKNSQTRDGKNVPTFREGTGILGLINVIMSGTDEFQKLQKSKTGASKKENQGMATKKDKEQADVTADLSKFYRVQTWCECTEFDFFTNDYAKKITYFIFPTLTPQLITPSEQEAATSGDYNKYITAQKSEALKNKGLLAKRYDYVYTGNNDSVIEFKIQLSSSFMQALPPADSSFVSDASQFGTKMDPKITPELLRNKQEIKKRWETNRTQIVTLEKSGKGDSEEANKLRKEQQQLKGSVVAEQKLKAKALGDARIFNNNQGRGTIAPSLHYADDYRVKEINDMELDPQFIVYRFLEDDVGTELTNGGVEGPYSKNRGSFAYMFNQLRQNGDLIQIKLNIVGDPYWFGRDNKSLSDLKKNIAGKKSMSADDADILRKNYADYEKGSNYFYIRIQGPSDYNESTGYMEFDTNDVISGVYLVKTVSSSFSDGRFTQTIEATKDLTILSPFIEKTEAQFKKERNDRLVSDKDFAQVNRKEIQKLADSKDVKYSDKAKEMLKRIK